MSKNKPVDWQTTADIIDNATDEELDAAMKELDPFPDMDAGEAVEHALKQFRSIGLMPEDGEEPDYEKQMRALGQIMNGDFDHLNENDDE